MKKIQYFKLFESRTAQLSENEFINLAKTKCKDFLASPKYLQRIKGSYNGDYSYINPKLSHRNPLMKDEGSGGVFSSHHTLLMDNLPSWNGFPKRTQSIIGSTNFGFDPSFGDHYYCIIPYDGANFGVAPDADLWNSYCEIILNTADTQPYMYQFDDYFSESFLQARISDDTFDDMMSDLQNLFNDYVSDKKPQIAKYIIRIFDKMKEDNIKDVKVAFNEYFSPDKFKPKPGRIVSPFLIMNYSEISSIPEKDSNGNLMKNGKEFWTDSECLIVYLGNVSSSRVVYENYNKVLELLS